MTQATHRTIKTNGIQMHIAEQGSGPLVVMCHGFPESWYSWRHQLEALAQAGYHAVAPDMRGYGQNRAAGRHRPVHAASSRGRHGGRPRCPGRRDGGHRRPRLGVRPSPGIAPCLRAGSISRGDRPQRALSRPWSGATDHGDAPDRHGAVLPASTSRRPGIAEAELERDPKSTIRRMLYAASGDASQGSGGAGQAGSTVGMGGSKERPSRSHDDPAGAARLAD